MRERITREKLFEDFPWCKPEWGYQIGDGWINLVYELCQGLEELKFEGKVEQIKEKFSGLRFYVNSATDVQHKLIDEAEGKSYTICESCGDKGRTTGKSWRKTLCEKCEELKK